jgi:hypothetical protein
MDDSAYFSARLQHAFHDQVRSLLGTRTSPRLQRRCFLRAMGWDGPALEQKLLDDCGEVTDAERELDERIGRENAILRAALATVDGDLLTGDRWRVIRKLADHLHASFGADRPYPLHLRDLTEPQLDELEEWVTEQFGAAVGGRST